jgi:hypothetical protein
VKERRWAALFLFLLGGRWYFLLLWCFLNQILFAWPHLYLWWFQHYGPIHPPPQVQKVILWVEVSISHQCVYDALAGLDASHAAESSRPVIYQRLQEFSDRWREASLQCNLYHDS